MYTFPFIYHHSIRDYVTPINVARPQFLSTINPLSRHGRAAYETLKTTASEFGERLKLEARAEKPRIPRPRIIQKL